MMKNLKHTILAFSTTVIVLLYSCGPNDDKGSMDEKNSDKEGAVDSTKIPNFDSSHTSVSFSHNHDNT